MVGNFPIALRCGPDCSVQVADCLRLKIFRMIIFWIIIFREIELLELLVPPLYSIWLIIVDGDEELFIVATLYFAREPVYFFLHFFDYF